MIIVSNTKLNCKWLYLLQYLCLNTLQGIEIIFRLGLTILLDNKEKLLNMDMERMLRVSYIITLFKSMCEVIV